MENLYFLKRFLSLLLIVFITSNSFAQDFITPIVNCVSYDEASGQYIAYFGYTNSHNETVNISNGKDNKLTPGKYKGQPSEFLPGTHNFVFQIAFNGSDLTWHIDSDPFHVNVKSTTANSAFNSCMSISSVVIDVSESQPLQGVTVTAIEAGLETSTNIEGLFSLSPVAQSDTINFFLAGYLPLKVAVPDLNGTRILLQKEITGLEPVFSSSVTMPGIEGDNLWPELYYLAEQNEAGFIFGSNEIFQIDSTDNTVLIEVWSNQGADIQALRNLLVSLGINNEINGGNSLLITGWFPIENLKSLNEDTQLINFVRPVFTPISSQGLVTSQADSVIKANWARNGYDLGGKGVKIGVLSDSYDADGSAAAGIVANGDLPGSENSGNLSAVEVLRDNPRGSNEGMGMLEIIHDIAPKANLGFRTGFLSPGDMANGIKELADAQYDVIVDDITYLTEPFKSSGQIAQAVSYASSLGVHYLTSAGNFGDKSYGAGFQPSASALDFAYLPTSETYAHDFGGGDIFQQLSLAPGTYVMELQWDDLFYSQGEMPGTAYDLDIWIVDDLGNLLYSGNRHNTGEDPIEITAFRITEQSIVNIMITGNSIPVGLDFQYVIFKGDGWSFREFPANSSTIIGHAASPDLASVGAIFYGYTPDFTTDSTLTKTNPYSSRGGNLMGTNNNKPDFIAADGANTSSFGSDVLFDQDNFPNFFGSSAAAPHAAGLMAVMLEAYDKFYDNSAAAIKREKSPADLRALLSTFSIDLDEPGADKISGAGLVDAQATLSSIASPRPQNAALFVPEGVAVGKEAFNLKVTAEFVNDETQLLLRGNALTITDRKHLDKNTTELTVAVNSFMGNPPINLYNPPMAGTNGLDGGLSDSLYFFSPQIKTITISTVDTTKVYGAAVPAFSYAVSPALSPEEMALLPSVAFETPANSLSDVGTYFVSPSFEASPNGEPAEIAVALQELYKFEFTNGALIVDPLAVTVTPDAQTINYGESLNTVTFNYDFDPSISLSYPDSVLANVTATHNAQLTQDTIAMLNRGLALVNRGLALVNNTAWTISDVALNRGLALVNNNNVVEIDFSILEDYENAPSGTLVNRGLALVNSAELANGNAIISLTDEDGNVISNRGLALVNRGLALVNRGLALVNEATGESASSKTVMVVSEDDSSIDSFSSINFITGLSAASAEDPHYIIPGALFSKNFLVTYEVAPLIIHKAPLTITAEDAFINEAQELPAFSSSISGYLFDQSFETVFGESEASYTLSPAYSGGAGLYDIIPTIEAPENYYLEAVNGILYVNPTLSGNKIKVQLECHQHLTNDPNGNTVRAYFSYENKDNMAWYIPEGVNNQLVGIDNYEGELPTVFLPGLHIFSIEWDGSKMNWRLTSTSTDKSNFASSENANSQGCIISDAGVVSQTSNFNYYPNPTRDYVNIEFISGNIMDASILVYNNQGFPINVPVNKVEYDNAARIDLSNMPADLYHVFVNHQGELTSIRIRKE